jgi:hypothetical protein
MSGQDVERELGKLFERVPPPELSATLRAAIAADRSAPERRRGPRLLSPRLGLGLVGLAAAALLVLVALPFVGGGPISGSKPSSTSAPTRASAVDGDFRLDFELAKDTWAPNEPIQGTATLSYTGKGRAQIVSGDPTIAFEYREVGGSKLMRPQVEDVCRYPDLAAGQPISTGLTKSGSIGNDPNAAFYRSFYPGPDVYLPLGEWQLTAIAYFEEGGCIGESTQHTLRVPLTIQIAGEGTPPASQPLPPSACARIYVVEPNETMASIAAMYNLQLWELELANSAKDPASFYPGMILCIPTPGFLTQPPPT